MWTDNQSGRGTVTVITTTSGWLTRQSERNYYFQQLNRKCHNTPLHVLKRFSIIDIPIHISPANNCAETKWTATEAVDAKGY